MPFDTKVSLPGLTIATVDLFPSTITQKKNDRLRCRIDDVEVDDVELNYDEVVMIEPTPRKRKRGKSKVPAVPSAVPDVDGTLTVVVHLITLTASGDQLTKSKKNVPIEIKNAARIVQNVDLTDARNNVNRPYISARVAHSLVVNHFGASAVETLNDIALSHDPNLSTRLKINTNPKYLVSVTDHLLFCDFHM